MRRARQILLKTGVAGFCFAAATALIAQGSTGTAGIPAGVGGTGIEGRPRSGGALHLALESDVQSLDPALTYDTVSGPVAGLLYHGLVDYDDGTQLVPWQADGWSLSANRRVYTFHLRPGVKFTNGRLVTAADYVYTLKRILDPKTKSPGEGFYRSILGARTFETNQALPPAGLRAPLPGTFEVELEAPDLSFIYAMAMPFAFVVARETAERYGEDFSQHPDGTGPYTLKEWSRGRRIRFERKPDAARNDPAWLDSIDFMIGGDSTTHLMMFERGELGISDVGVNGIPIPDFRRVLRTPALRRGVEALSMNAIRYLAMNTEIPPFDDVRVRQAMSYAVNKQRLVGLINGRGLPATGVLPPLLPGYNPKLKGYEYNPVKARELLREAGHPEGFSSELWLQDNLAERRMAEAIQQDLAEVGINLRLKTVAGSIFTEGIERRKVAPCNLDGWYEDYPDPGDFLDVLLNGNRITEVNCNNHAFYNNAAVNKLLQEAARCPDPERRFHLYQEAEAKVVGDAPWVFLFYPYLHILHQPWLRGCALHAVWEFRYERMWMQR
jgi:oligopeptide transport system substrate-binding protein